MRLIRQGLGAGAMRPPAPPPPDYQRLSLQSLLEKRKQRSVRRRVAAAEKARAVVAEKKAAAQAERGAAFLTKARQPLYLYGRSTDLALSGL